MTQPIPLFPSQPRHDAEESRGGLADVALDRIREQALARSAELAAATREASEEASRAVHEQARARLFAAAAQTRVAEANQRLVLWSVAGLIAGAILIPRLFEF